MSLATLVRMFEDVPLPSEVPSRFRGGKQVPDKFVPDDIPLGPIADPRAWLSRFYIPVETARLDGAAAQFRMRSNGGEFKSAVVLIDPSIDESTPFWRRCVWHEIGHAMDNVSTREQQAIATPHGMFSTEHVALLREHEEVIVSWFEFGPGITAAQREYATQPAELWAETVARCVCNVDIVPPKLLEGIKQSLTKRLIPIGT